MRVLVLGGYGFFGSRIVTLLARETGLEILIAGRDPEQAAALAARITPSATVLTPLPLDIHRPDFTDFLYALAPHIVIHTCGPFQGQDYRIAEACLRAGCHYVDLADGRAFVTGITSLDARARERGVLIVSGASSVPGLSGAVVAALAPVFARMDSIHISISPGNKTDRGLATVRGILSYAGEAIPLRLNGQQRTVTGWGDISRHRFDAPVGRRWLSDCEVPDLSLLPERYPDLHTVRFRAGLELGVLHAGMVLMACLRRWRLLPNLAALAVPLKRISEWFLSFGTDAGAMSVHVRGLNAAGQPMAQRWQLLAENGDGPYVPTLCSVAMVRRLLRDGTLPSGALPAPAVLTLADILAVADGLAIRTRIDGEQP